MRRAFALVAPVLLIVSCTPGTTRTPQEVLTKSALANQNLQSVAFSLTGNAAMEGMSGTQNIDLTATGRMQDGGKQTTFEADLRHTSAAPDGSTVTIRAHGQVTVAGEDETYLHLDTYTVEPRDDDNSDLMAQLTGQWWRMPQSQSGSLQAEIPASFPDARLLSMQSAALTVTDDHGIDTMHDRPAHHYSVGIDPAKLAIFLQETAKRNGSTMSAAEWRTFTDNLVMTGETWIDAETFHTSRLRWHITSRDAQAFAADFTVDFVDHNAAAPIVPPADARPFPTLLPQWSTLIEGSDAAAAPDTQLTPEQQQEILDSLLNDQ